ncbi:hypothetical protein A9Q96_14440 [Rhodobacterales bacterium 52_120_T64]|nr:hypothetical protein A9Q96_14440 [Rhodobacterales bacterium 52_120_T64]
MKIIANHTYLPLSKMDVLELISAKGDVLDAGASKMVENTGFNSLARVQNESTDNFIKLSAENFSDQCNGSDLAVDNIIVVTQSYEQRLPNISSTLQGLLKLPTSTFCVDIVDGCNGFIRALTIANKITETGMRTLIVGGDVYSPMTRRAELSTDILFGDGYSFTIVEQDNEPFRSKIMTDGTRGHFINASYRENVLNMNGVGVFLFTNSEIPKLIKSLDWELDPGNGLPTYYALHQASKLIVNQLSKKLKLDNGEVPFFSCSEIGNLGPGSIGAWISANSSKLNTKANLTCLGYGAGLSWGVASLQMDLMQNGVQYIDA